jgi:hypothetical protein
MAYLRALAGLGLIATLGACVQDGDLTSGAIGAGIGCVAGEVLADGRCVEGAVLGTGAGVATNRVIN